MVETRRDNLTYALLFTSRNVTVCGCLKASAAASTAKKLYARAMLAKESLQQGAQRCFPVVSASSYYLALAPALAVVKAS